MPADFLVQSPDVANPPTLFLPLADMAQVIASAAPASQQSDASLAGSAQEDLEFLRAGVCARQTIHFTFCCVQEVYWTKEYAMHMCY